jgi:hypothetical protein
MNAPFLSNVPVRTQRRMGARLPRWLIAAGAVALAGVSIDLFGGPPASALPSRTSQIQALPVPYLDHSVVSMLADEPPLKAGTSVAAYDAVASEDPALASAAAASLWMADDALEPGTSIAAYDR